MARPLIAWRDEQLRALAAALEQALAGWSADWGVHAAGAVTCQSPAPFESALAWRRLLLGAQPAGWLQLSLGAARGVVDALFKESAALGPIALALASACERDVTARLLSAVGVTAAAGPDAGPAPTDLYAWSGIVDVRLPAPLAWRLLLQPVAVAAWWEARGGPIVVVPAGPQRAALAPVLDAVAGRSMRLDVQLAGCDIDLGALQRLQPGDVVRVQHRIDAPATVCDDAGAALFAAYLGRRAGSKAVELAAPGARQDPPPTRKVQP
ncbi:FliM/FliN family flagellar motor C-terminal domain-containing protein [Ramlibacter sp.]|uniref:FliM/FliN family flagellar motor C-terminal domain-containing protein n=1 Tax=Ramlibacter sp. TaxID=1917967 RepID=UPI002637F0E9|nr:FliM/FliN family flagellar motor C-terminal domain-containing protein [Ramlibacter sp.]